MVGKESKEAAALAAATEVFTRYGYARTTMGDIAAKAGMSRPALYLIFPDKEAAFARVIHHIDRCKFEEISTALPMIDGLERKLLHACLAWGLHGVELAATHPDAADLFDLRFPAVRQVYANFQAFVAELISDAVRRSGFDIAANELARTIVFGLRGLREAANGPDDMRQLITVHVRAFARALDAPPSGRRGA